MKIIFSFILGVFCLCFPLSCVSNSASNSLLYRDWMMVSFSSIPKDEFIRSKVSIHLNKDEKTEKNRGKVFTGSNTIVFNFKIKDSKRIKIQNIKSQDFNSEQTHLHILCFEFLKKVKTYQKEGHFLILYDEKGNAMKLVASDWD